MADNETKKAEEKMKKEWSIQEIRGTLTPEQNMLLSFYMHVYMQMGRVVGRMEMDGKTAEEIATTVNAPVDVIKKALEEDPFEVIKQ